MSALRLFITSKAKLKKIHWRAESLNSVAPPAPPAKLPGQASPRVALGMDYVRDGYDLLAAASCEAGAA